MLVDHVVQQDGDPCRPPRLADLEGLELDRHDPRLAVFTGRVGQAPLPSTHVDLVEGEPDGAGDRHGYLAGTSPEADMHPTYVPPQNLLVLGANGHTGRLVIARALAAGHRVTAVVRAPDRLTDIQHEKLAVEVGSPAPAVRRVGLRSRICTSNPRDSSARAAQSPPGPAPATRMGFMSTSCLFGYGSTDKDGTRMSLKSDAQTDARKKPVQPRAKETVRALVEATAHLLREGGVDAVSTHAVALRAGVSIGSLYQYYPSRESLIAAVV